MSDPGHINASTSNRRTSSNSRSKNIDEIDNTNGIQKIVIRQNALKLRNSSGECYFYDHASNHRYSKSDKNLTNDGFGIRNDETKKPSESTFKYCTHDQPLQRPITRNHITEAKAIKTARNVAK